MILGLALQGDTLHRWGEIDSLTTISRPTWIYNVHIGTSVDNMFVSRVTTTSLLAE